MVQKWIKSSSQLIVARLSGIIYSVDAVMNVSYLTLLKISELVRIAMATLTALADTKN